MNNSVSVKENKMGYMPIGKLLASMAVPMMISMLVNAFYNVVDSIFVSQLSENALSAVSLAFPLQNLNRNMIHIYLKFPLFQFSCSVVSDSL